MAVAGKKYPPSPVTDVKGRTRLAVSEPANSVFWAWEPVEGAGLVSIKYGDAALTTSTDLSGLINKGEQLRITAPAPPPAADADAAAMDVEGDEAHAPPVHLRLDVHAEAALTPTSVPLKSRCLCPITVVEGTVERKVGVLWGFGVCGECGLEPKERGTVSMCVGGLCSRPRVATPPFLNSHDLGDQSPGLRRDQDHGLQPGHSTGGVGRVVCGP